MIDHLYMKWSKLKQRIEDGFADCAKGRVEVWNARYRTAHDHEGRAWITIDKEQVYSMGSLTYYNAVYGRSWQLQKDRDCLDYWQDETKHARYLAAYDEVVEQADKEGVISRGYFNDTLFAYLNMPMDDILCSDRVLVRALGMFDKRLGKRRLKSIDVSKEHEIVQKFYCIRCAFEGMRPNQATSVENGHSA